MALSFGKQYLLKVSIGKQAPAPVPRKIAQAIVSAEITRGDVAPSGFELVLTSQLSLKANDYDLMTDPLLDEFNRVKLEVMVSGKPTLLMDGFITEKELHQSESRIVVRGDDLSLKMAMIELSWPYPEKKPSTIVTEVLGRYKTFGIKAEVKAPANEVVPKKFTPHQLSTDRDYLNKLAKDSDCKFYIKMGTSPTAYWGPAERSGSPQPTLTSNAVAFGNVDKLEPETSGLAAELNYGTKLADGDGGKESAETPFGAKAFGDTALSKSPAPVKDFASLAADPESFESKLKTLMVRGRYMRHQQLSAENAGAAAQARTDSATADTAKIKGELDTARYGHILQAPGIVGVRGAGKNFDGRYYVQEVSHKFNLQRGALSYKQAFVLTREGVGAKQQALGR